MPTGESKKLASLLEQFCSNFDKLNFDNNFRFQREVVGRGNARRESVVDKETIFVPMNFALATSATEEKPCIGTTSLASCAGIAIYDEENKVGGVAHVFFNEKQDITDYLHDSQGRQIPSSGKARVIDMPLSQQFTTFKYVANELLSVADAKGGKKYKFMVFNVKHGWRKKEQNQELERVVEEVIQKLKQVGKIEKTEYRNEQAFKLDTRSGSILPYEG